MSAADGTPMSRRALRQRGEAMREELFGPEGRVSEGGDSAPGFRDLLSEVTYGTVWARPGLGAPDRMLCTLAALGAVGRPRALARYVGAALRMGLEPPAIQEVLIQIGIYAGFPASEEALAVAAEVFGQRGRLVPRAAGEDESLETLAARGADLLRALHGERAAQGYASPANAVTGALYPLAVQYGYGAIWFRPGLDRRQRALCAVAAFTALRLEGQARKFAQAALAVGLTRTEVIEAVVQTAPFSGFAPALNALAALADVLPA